MVLAAGFLYSQIFKQPFQEYLAYVVAGVLAWNLMSSLIIEGTSSVIDSEPLVKSIPLPLSVLAARMVVRNLIIFAHNVVFAVLLFVLFQMKFTPMMLFALVGVVLYSFLGFFIALLLGPISARFRDVPLVVSNVIGFMLFLTPLLWKADQLPKRAIFVHGNPFYHFVELVRAPIIEGRMATLESWIICICITLIVGVLALLTLPHVRQRVYFWL
jgi:ABC-type polysaccharide/polyol phosphate export permease